MTSTGSRGSEVMPTAHLSPSASVTSSQVPAQSDGLTNVSPTSFTDVASTQAQFANQNVSKLQSPYISIRATSSTSQAESVYISRTGLDSSVVPPLADVIPTAQSLPPSWNPSSSSLNPSTEYSSGFSSSVSMTPSLPLPATPSQTDVIIPSSSEQSPTSNMVSTSTDVIDSYSTIQTSQSTPLKVPTAPKTNNILPTDKAVKTQPTKDLKPTTWSHMATAPPVMATSSIGAGVFSGDTTPGRKGQNKTGAIEPSSGMPKETILIILVPVCVVVLLIFAVVLVTCIKRRKNAKKQTVAQNPDLWVNTRAEISLVPQTPSALETPIEIVPGFQPGDRVYRVIYGFTAQLEGQMTITEKELVKVMEMADNGWWRGVSESGTRSGWFPGCYVEEIKKTGQAEEGPQTKRSRVSSFMLKKRERNRKKSATSVSPYVQSPDYPVPPLYASTSALPSLNSADISRFNDGKLYRALFAYQGSSKGELSIQEGDILRAWEKDRNGWMHGRKETDREEGWFPAVYVDEIPSDTASISGESTHSCPVIYDQLAPNKTRSSDQEWLGIEHRAIYPYPGHSETDLTFDSGDIIIIYETLDNGWWLGSRGEEVGWLPGSYLEILDVSKDDDSKSDVSSVLSSGEDRSRVNDEDTSDITSNNSVSTTLNSTFSDPKPKPARRAPPPPKPKPLKPLKIPDRCQHNLQATSSFKSELHNVILDQASLNNERPSPSLMAAPSNSRPKRPAPAPPKRNNSQKSPIPSQPGSPMQELVPTTVATSSVSPSENKLKPGEKPALPRRFAKPKVIRIPRQSSRLQNLAINSRPSSRPAPPRPPPPKINMHGKTAGIVQSSNCISGKYLKKTETELRRSPSNPVNITKSDNSLQTAGIYPGDHTQHLTPRKVPPVVLPPKAISHMRNPSIDRPVSCPGEMVPNKPTKTVPIPSPREKPPDRAPVSEKSPDDQSVVPSVNTQPEDTASAISDSRSTGETSPFPDSPVYYVEKGPSLSPPVVDSPVTPVAPPVQRPVDDAPIYQVINKEAKRRAPAVPRVQDTGENGSSVQTEPEQDQSGGEAPALAAPTGPENKDLDTNKVIGPMSAASPADNSNTTADEAVSSPVLITTLTNKLDIGEDKDVTSPVLSATPTNNIDSDADMVISSPVLGSSPTNNLDHNVVKDPIVNLVSRKPTPKKPSRIPPPTLPKPKIINPPSAIDVPPEGVSGRVSHIIKEIDKFSSHKDMSDSSGPVKETAHPETATPVDNVNVSPSSDESDTCLGRTSPVEFAASPGPNSDGQLQTHDARSTDIDEEVGENCDTLLTNDEISYDSDKIILGHDIGESDDLELDTQTSANGDVEDVDSVEDNPPKSADAAPEPDFDSSLSEPYNGQLEFPQPINSDAEPSADQTEPSNGLPEPPHAQTEPLSSDAEHADDSSSEQSAISPTEPLAPSNGLPEVPNGHSEVSPEQSESTIIDDQPPVPTKATPPVKKPRSPRKERSPAPPARPLTPKSPPPRTQKMGNPDGGGANKKTLRRAVMSHVPQGKGELTFEEGSFIKEMSKAIGRPGWCIGMLADGTTGLYPQSHVVDASNRQSVI